MMSSVVTASTLPWPSASTHLEYASNSCRCAFGCSVWNPRPGWSALTPMTSFLLCCAFPTTPVCAGPLPPLPPPDPPPHAPENPSASARPVSTASVLLSRIAPPSTVDTHEQSDSVGE